MLGSNNKACPLLVWNDVYDFAALNCLAFLLERIVASNGPTKMSPYKENLRNTSSIHDFSAHSVQKSNIAMSTSESGNNRRKQVVIWHHLFSFYCIHISRLLVWLSDLLHRTEHSSLN